jgi:hypothetical protein
MESETVLKRAWNVETVCGITDWKKEHGE